MKLHWIENERLAAGGVPVNRADLESLRERGIGAVISLTEYPLTRFKGINDALLVSLGLDYLHVPVVDHTAPDVRQVSEVAQYVDRMKAHGTPVYIHCAAGIGRTGTMLHAYYVVSGDALDTAKKKVKAAKPSSQFMMLSSAQQMFLDDLAQQFRQPPAQSMETVYFQVLPGKEADFEVSFLVIARVLDVEALHYALHRATDIPGRYLLIVYWRGEHGGFDTLDLPEIYDLLDMPLVEAYRAVNLKDETDDR